MTRAGSAVTTLARRLSPHDPMHRSAIALAANTGLTSALGFVYWVVAAQYYSPAAIGESAALISALLLLANIAGLNLNNTLIRFLPTAGSETVRYVRRAYAAVLGASLLVGLVAVPLLGNLTLVRYLFGLGWPGAAFLLVAMLAWPLFSLQDAVAIGARAALWVPVENAAFGVGKLLLLVALAGIGRLGILASWLAAMLVTLAGMTLLVFRRLLPRHAAESAAGHTEQVTRRDVAGFLTVDNLALLATAAVNYLLPVLVATRAGLEANGYFFVAWSIGTALDVALLNVASSLTVEGARRREHLGTLVLVLLRRIVLLAVPVVAVLLVAAPLILSMYGGSYAAHSTGLLRLVALAMLPRIVVVVWVSTSRVRQRLGRILAVQCVAGIAVLGLSSALVGQYGIATIGFVYLVTQTVAALAVLPDLVAVVRSPGAGTVATTT